MESLILIHNSDQKFEVLSPPDNKRPLFYWYTDRFCSHIGTQKYIYIFIVNPEKDDIELKARDGEGFDSVHKSFLDYKNYTEGKSDLKYVESGIVMSFSKMKPEAVLVSTSFGSGIPDYLSYEYEILYPYKPFSKRIINIFEEPYNDIYQGKPVPFNQISELVDLVPEISNSYPVISPSLDKDGKCIFDDWNEMSGYQNRTWL